MTDLNSALRETIRQVVREELAAVEKRRAEAAPPPADELLTTADAAKLVKVTAPTVRDWIAEGRLPAVTVSGRYRVRRGDVMAVASGKAPPKRTKGAQVQTLDAIAAAAAGAALARGKLRRR